MSQYLIVGGEHDGQWIDAHPGARLVQRAIRISSRALIVPGDEAAAEHFTTVVSYTRRSWHCEGADWIIYAPPEDSDATVFERLMRNYRPRR